MCVVSVNQTWLVWANPILKPPHNHHPRVPPKTNSLQDSIVWPFSNSGEYQVKQVYQLIHVLSQEKGMKTIQPKSSPRIHRTKFGRLNFPRKSKPLCGTFSMTPSQLEQSSVKEDYRSQAIVLFAMRGRKLYHISFCIATLQYPKP